MQFSIHILYKQISDLLDNFVPQQKLNAIKVRSIHMSLQSGLTEASRKSHKSIEEADNEVVQFVEKYTKKGNCPLAGNSVHADKRFIDKYMPKFKAHLHYRIVDVSTVKELCR